MERELMISVNDLIAYGQYFMGERQLEKDYLQSLLLFELYNTFASELVFKGGTALKLFYGLDRFSEDLDFTYVLDEPRKETVAKTAKVLTSLNLSYTVRSIKRRGTKTSLDYELRIEGPLFGNSRTAQNIMVNMSMREKTIEKPDLKYLSVRYPDIRTFAVYVLGINEILAEKVRAILVRKRLLARDIYDLYYLTKFKESKPDQSLINKKLSVYNQEFSPAKLVSRIKSMGKQGWKSELSNLVRDVPDYDSITNYLEEVFLKFQ